MVEHFLSGQQGSLMPLGIGVAMCRCPFRGCGWMLAEHFLSIRWGSLMFLDTGVGLYRCLLEGWWLNVLPEWSVKLVNAFRHRSWHLRCSLEGWWLNAGRALPERLVRLADAFGHRSWHLPMPARGLVAEHWPSIQVADRVFVAVPFSLWWLGPMYSLWPMLAIGPTVGLHCRGPYVSDLITFSHQQKSFFASSIDLIWDTNSK